MKLEFTKKQWSLKLRRREPNVSTLRFTSYECLSRERETLYIGTK